MNDVGLVSWCVQRVSRQNLRVLKHMHIKSAITLRSPMPGGLGPLELICDINVHARPERRDAFAEMIYIY